MDAETRNELAAAHATLSSVQEQTSNFVSDILDLLTDQATRRPDLLRRVVELRTEAADLHGQAEDALADLARALGLGDTIR